MNKIISCLIISFVLVNIIKGQETPCTVSKLVTSCTSKQVCPTITDCLNLFLEQGQHNMFIYILNDFYGDASDCVGQFTIPYSVNLSISSAENYVNKPVFQCPGTTFLSLIFTGHYSNIGIGGLEINGLKNTNGGCVAFMTESSTYLNYASFSNVQIGNCSNSYGGGAVFAENFNVYSQESIFLYNSGTYGGAILTTNPNSSVSIYSTEFIGNTAYDNGGAIFSGNVNVYDSSFYANDAQIGGAIYSNNLLTYNSTFEFNSAAQGSALAYLPTDTSQPGPPILQIYNSLFQENKCTDFGTLVFGSQNITITKSTFQQNDCNDGSAIFSILSEGELNLFFDNETIFQGNKNNQSGTIIDFQENPSHFTGGIFYSYGPTQFALPSDYLKTNNANVNSTENCGGSPVVISSTLPYYQCYNVIGQCFNGFAVVVQQKIVSCSCFESYTGPSCNQKFPVINLE